MTGSIATGMPYRVYHVGFWPDMTAEHCQEKCISYSLVLFWVIKPLNYQGWHNSIWFEKHESDEVIKIVNFSSKTTAKPGIVFSCTK